MQLTIKNCSALITITALLLGLTIPAIAQNTTTTTETTEYKQPNLDVGTASIDTNKPLLTGVKCQCQPM